MYSTDLRRIIPLLALTGPADAADAPGAEVEGLGVRGVEESFVSSARKGSEGSREEHLIMICGMSKGCEHTSARIRIKHTLRDQSSKFRNLLVDIIAPSSFDGVVAFASTATFLGSELRSGV